jgi:galactokinase/mevalonate kinase-like predicted kinase
MLQMSQRRVSRRGEESTIALRSYPEIALAPLRITFGGIGGRTAFPRAEASGGMIVNLNQYRKKRQRAEAEARAVENRIRFGRSKGERSKEQRETERAKKEIDDKRLD